MDMDCAISKRYENLFFNPILDKNTAFKVNIVADKARGYHLSVTLSGSEYFLVTKFFNSFDSENKIFNVLHHHGQHHLHHAHHDPAEKEKVGCSDISRAA